MKSKEKMVVVTSRGNFLNGYQCVALRYISDKRRPRRPRNMCGSPLKKETTPSYFWIPLRQKRLFRVTYTN